MDTRLAELLDREAIRELITNRYAADVDWLDMDDFRDCFTTDSQVHFAGMSLSGPAFCDLWTDLGGGFQMRYHLLSCARIYLDGDRATAEARGIVASTYPDPNAEDGQLRDQLEGSHYFFEVEREADGQWRICDMTITFAWTFMQPHAEKTAAGSPFSTGMDTSHALYRRIVAQKGVQQ